ncbi:hypothetical protein ASZ78_013101 [Callipepla squamata]|uniref:Alanine--glyoxylate aminotransferase 2, mitochondrial n=1 Tax=Callipepla squamata TaxID=9009 RepID=A0A226NH22_CALSU|nr:hypothetical protein ASZ78_013101 [Callipepla squamata]
MFSCFCLHRGAYHGGSPYVLGLTSISSYKHGVANGIGCSTFVSLESSPGMIKISGRKLSSSVSFIPDRQCYQMFSVVRGEAAIVEILPCKLFENAAVLKVGVCHANEQYIEQFRDTLNTSVPKTIAGFIAEPIQGVNGTVQYPKGFLKEAYQLVRERGGVCISDEVSVFT